MGDASASHISELPDLEDRIDVLESLIQDLSKPKIGKGELEVLLNQYSILEESINTGIEYLSRNVKSVQDKKQLDSNSDKFNKINSDFQENWNDEYWRCYEMIKDGNKKKGYKPDLNVRVAHLQELATTLNKNINEDKTEDTEKTEEIQQVPEVNVVKNVGPDPLERKCCSCVIC